MRARLFVLSLLLAGCNPAQNYTAAQAASDKFHQELDAGAFSAIYDSTDPEYRKDVDREKGDKLLRWVRTTGTNCKRDLVNWRTSVTTQYGNVAELQYKVQCEKGALSELLTWHMTASSPQLLGYHVNKTLNL
jgi:hypothetical protein